MKREKIAKISSWWLTKKQLHYMRKIEAWLNQRLDSLVDESETTKTHKRGYSQNSLRTKLQNLAPWGDSGFKLTEKEAGRILEEFVKYYQKNYTNVLSIGKTALAGNSVEYIWFNHRSTRISEYSEVLAQARLLLEVASDILVEEGKASLIEHQALKTAFVKTYSKVDKDIFANLDEEDKYQRFKDARKKLIEAKLIEPIEEAKDKKTKTTPYRFDTSRTLEEAIETLRLHLQKSKGSKTKSRLRVLKGADQDAKKSVRDYINDKCQSIECVDCEGRTLYHWYRCALILKFSEGDTNKLYESIIIYLRYFNLKTVITDIKEDDLYPWDPAARIWTKLIPLIEKELGEKFKLPTHISEEQYHEAADTLLSALSRAVKASDSDSQLSLRYVQATVAYNSSLPEASHMLDELLTTILSQEYSGYEFDICLIMPKYIGSLVRTSSGSILSVSYRMLYILDNLPENKDVAQAKASVYFFMYCSSDEEEQGRILDDYRSCVEKEAKDLQSIWNKYEFIQVTDTRLFKDSTKRILREAWNEAVVLYEKENNPHCFLLVVKLFFMAASFLDEIIDFGYTLALLSVRLYLLGRTNGIREKVLKEEIFPLLEYSFCDIDKDLADRIAFMHKENLITKYVDKERIKKELNSKCTLTTILDILEEALRKMGKVSPLDYTKMVESAHIKFLMIDHLYYAGQYEKANAIIKELQQFYQMLQRIFPENQRDEYMKSFIDDFRYFEYRRQDRPLYGREKRLEFVLDCISNIEEEDRSGYLIDFLDRWGEFSFFCEWHRDCLNEYDLNNFQSAEFLEELENLASWIPEHYNKLDLSALTEDDLNGIYSELARRFNIQRSIQLDDENEACLSDGDLDAEDITPGDIFRIIDVMLAGEQE